MGELIEIPRATYREVRLEETIAEAETLGSVRMDQNWQKKWSVCINFVTRSGSHIFAKGEAASLLIAVGLAINEARALGAGEQP